MAEDLDDVVAREFRVLDDLDVPDLWARIVAFADTEPLQSSRSRRRWPAVAAAAALVVAIAGGVWLTVRDDSEPSSTPVDSGVQTAAADANTVRVVFGDDDTAFDAEAVAGWVSFEIDNPTDDFRFVDLRPLRPGSTFEEARAELATVDDGDTSVMERVTEATLVGTLIRPHGTVTVDGSDHRRRLPRELRRARRTRRIRGQQRPPARTSCSRPATPARRRSRPPSTR